MPYNKKTMLTAGTAVLLIGVVAAFMFSAISALAFVVGFAAATVITWTAAIDRKDFSAIERAQQRLGAGDFTVRVSPDNGSPRRLCRSFNEMADELEKKFEGRVSSGLPSRTSGPKAGFS